MATTGDVREEAPGKWVVWRPELQQWQWLRGGISADVSFGYLRNEGWCLVSTDPLPPSVYDPLLEFLRLLDALSGHAS